MLYRKKVYLLQCSEKCYFLDGMLSLVWPNGRTTDTHAKMIVIIWTWNMRLNNLSVNQVADVTLLNLLLVVFNKNLLQNVTVLKQFRDTVSEKAGYLLLNINNIQDLPWIFNFGEYISFLLCCDNLLSYGTLCDLPQHCFLSYLNSFHTHLLRDHFPLCFHMHAINIASNFILAQIFCFSNMGLRPGPCMVVVHIFVFTYITSIK